MHFLNISLENKQNEDQVMKYLTFGGFIKFALQIYYNHKKFLKGNSVAKKRGFYSNRRRIGRGDSKTNLNWSVMRHSIVKEQYQNDCNFK